MNLYNETDWSHFTEAKAFNSIDDIMDSLTVQQTNGGMTRKIYKSGILTKKTFPEEIRDAVDGGEGNETVMEAFDTFLKNYPSNTPGHDASNHKNEILGKLIANTKTPDQLLKAVNDSKDAINFLALNFNSPKLKQIPEYNEVMDDEYDPTIWHNFENKAKEIFSAKDNGKDKDPIYEGGDEDGYWKLFTADNFEEAVHLSHHIEDCGLDSNGKELTQAHWCTASDEHFYNNYSYDGKRPLYIIKRYVDNKCIDAWQVAFMRDHIEIMDKMDEREFSMLVYIAPDELLSKIVDVNNIPAIKDYVDYKNVLMNQEDVRSQSLSKTDLSVGLVLGLFEIPEFELDDFYEKILCTSYRDEIEKIIEDLNKLKNSDIDFSVGSTYPVMTETNEYSTSNPLETLSDFVYDMGNSINYLSDMSYNIDDILYNLPRDKKISKDEFVALINSLKDKYPEESGELSANIFQDDLESALSDNELLEEYSIEELTEMTYLYDAKKAFYSVEIIDGLKKYKEVDDNLQMPFNLYCTLMDPNIIENDQFDPASEILSRNVLGMWDKIIKAVNSRNLDKGDAIIYMAIGYYYDDSVVPVDLITKALKTFGRLNTSFVNYKNVLNWLKENNEIVENMLYIFNNKIADKDPDVEKIGPLCERLLVHLINVTTSEDFHEDQIDMILAGFLSTISIVGEDHFPKNDMVFLTILDKLIEAVVKDGSFTRMLTNQLMADYL